MVAAPPLEIDLNPASRRIAPLPRCAAIAALLLVAGIARSEIHVVIVEGLGGEPRYTEEFGDQSRSLEQAARTLTDPANIRVFAAEDARRDAIRAWFDELAGNLEAGDRAMIYLVGHGSWDDHEYKFNLPGPDLTGADIRAALEALPAGERLLVVTGSASGALAERLADLDLAAVFATRSGVERHATRFGSYFAEALSAPAADTDKNGVITADEAFGFATRRVADYFERESRLATEHARLEGDGADRLAVARLSAMRPAAPAADAELERLFDERTTLNARIDELRLRRDDMEADAYRAELLDRMLELARLEDAIEARQRELAGAGDDAERERGDD